MSEDQSAAPETPEPAKSPEQAPVEVVKEAPKGGPSGVIYGLDDKPELPKAMVLALQHVLTMFGATVAVPLLLGPAMNMSAENIAILVSSVMLCSGLATLCQVTIGSRLPIIQGVSFSFLAPFFAIIGAVAAQVQVGEVPADQQGMVTMQYIAGAVLSGAVFEILIGYSGLVGLLRKFLTPVVIGPVIMLIGLSLFQHGAPKAGADVLVSSLTIGSIILFSLVLSRKLLIFRLFPILLAVMLAWGLCTVCSMSRVFEPELVLVKGDGESGLAERFRLVSRSDALALQAKLSAEQKKSRAELAKLFEERRNSDGQAEVSSVEDRIRAMRAEQDKRAAKLAGVKAMLKRVVGASCVVAAGSEQGLAATKLAAANLSVGYGTELPKDAARVLSLAPAHPSYVDLSKASEAPLLRVNPKELVFPWGLPKFNLGFLIAVLFAYLASMIESFGDYHACSYMAGGGTPTARQISNGIGSEGVGCAITGVFGGFASTSYSENIGLIGLTKVGSRYVVAIASVFLVVLGLFSKFGAFAATIPGPVVGALYCTLFGLISAVGIQQLAKADLSSDRNLFIAGFALFMGLSVPTFFTAKTSGLQPGDLQAVYLPTADAFLSWFPTKVAETVATIGKSGMGVAALIGLVLDNLIPGTEAERGIEKHD